MANIKFEIFRNRKKFNIINWLKRSKDKSYESFVSFLESKSVITPGEEYFRKALDLLDSMMKREEQFQESKEVKSEDKPEVVKKETVPIKVEVELPELPEVNSEVIEVEAVVIEEPKEETKPKTRRRRRKKVQDES